MPCPLFCEMARAVEASRDGVWVLDGESHVMAMAPALRAALDLPEGWTTWAAAEGWSDPESWRELNRAFCAALPPGQVLRHEGVTLARGGRQRWVNYAEVLRCIGCRPQCRAGCVVVVGHSLPLDDLTLLAA